MKLSAAAESISSSPILTLAAEINGKIAQGAKIYNLTIGDFNSQIYPIPERLTELTIEAYRQHQTNYPGAFGVDELRLSIIRLLKDYCAIDVEMNEVQVASGSRPLIYTLYKTLVDEGDKVVFPTPSWNNDFYCELHHATSVLVLFLLFRLIHRSMVKYLPAYQKPHRSLSIRLTDLIYRIFTILILFLTPLVVFYLREDWVLFSIVLLVLIGAAWGIRKVAPFYWKQAILLLNIGSVREGERLFYEGLPWKVERINFFTDLVNPTAKLSHRIPLEKMVGKISRPVRRSNEQWFPCKQGDWVILDDGTRGEVISITHEFIELQKRGGATKTYLMQDFLAQAPLNLSVSFRIKEIFGISYALQQQSTNIIIGKLKSYIHEKLEKEGHAPFLIDMKVEFNEAADSSLNLVVIADFKGELAPLLNRLRRAIQRWCVDAASANEWEIPFPQLTLHRANDE